MKLQALLKSAKFRSLLAKYKTAGVNVRFMAHDNLQYQGESVYGLTTPGNNFRVEIHSSLLNSSKGGIGVISTIIHEIIHARILAVRQSELAENLKENYPGIYDYYQRYGPGKAQHELMAVHYRPLIKEIIQEVSPELSEEDCEALSWAGLYSTSAWENLGRELQGDHKNRISKYKKAIS